MPVAAASLGPVWPNDWPNEVTSRGFALQQEGDGQDVEKYRERQRRWARFTPDPDHVKVDGERYEVVGEEERVDPEWEAMEAERRRRAWEAEQARRERDRRAEREAMTLGQRLDRAVFEIEVGKGLRARPIKAESNSADKTMVGPAKPGGPELEARLRLIRHHIAMIERDADGEKNHARPIGDGRFLTTDERDRIVWEDFQGVRAEVVAREAPYLGTSARTIERARVAEAARRGVRVKPVTGEVLGEQAAAA